MRRRAVGAVARLASRRRLTARGVAAVREVRAQERVERLAQRSRGAQRDGARHRRIAGRAHPARERDEVVGRRQHVVLDRPADRA